MPNGVFDSNIAIEVFEHVADLEKLGAFMKEHLSSNGLLWIQTMIHPNPTPSDVLNSWYIAPRNRHISIFTFPAITVLFRRCGINIILTAIGLFGVKDLLRFPNRVFVRA